MSKQNTESIRKYKSIAKTLVIAFITSNIIILLLTLGFELYVGYSALRKDIVQQQRLIASEAGSTVHNFISSKFDSLLAASRLSDILHAPDELQKLSMDRLLGLNPTFRRAALVDSDMNEIQRSSRLSSSVAKDIPQQVFEEMGVHIAKDEIFMSSVYIDEITSEPMMIIAQPIGDVLRQRSGAIWAEVNLKFMWDMMGRLKVGQSGHAFVVDRTGNLIACKDVSRILRHENLSYLTEVREFMDDNRTEDAEILTGFNGNKVVSNFVAIGKPDWAVVIEMPVLEAYDNILQLLKLSTWAILFNIALAIIIGLYLSKLLTLPLVNLRNAAKEISLGNLDYAIEPGPNNEIGELSDTLTQMKINLKQYRKKMEDYNKDLESTVAERTKELSMKMDETERLNNLMVGRELKMIELKKEIDELKEKITKSGI